MLLPLDNTLSRIPQFVTNADTTLAHSGADESTVIEPFDLGTICENCPFSKLFLIASIDNSFAAANIARVYVTSVATC